MSGAVATATGAAVGRAVNNGLQVVINKATGAITQGWDQTEGQIRNVAGTWTGTGGYDPTKPLDNVVGGPVRNSAGSTVFTYKDGTVRTIDAEGNQTVTQGSNNSGISSFFNRPPPTIRRSGHCGGRKPQHQHLTTPHEPKSLEEQSITVCAIDR